VIVPTVELARLNSLEVPKLFFLIPKRYDKLPRLFFMGVVPLGVETG